MKKSFSKKIEQAARKHSKNGIKSKECFISGAEFCDKNSPNQFDEKEMFQMLYDGVGHFAHKHNITISGSKLQSWFKQYLKSKIKK